MSAIWQRNLEVSRRAQILSAQLEPRDFPEVFLVPQSAINEGRGYILGQVFDNPFSSWLYGAVIQIAYNGSQPAWSRNGWSFAPVNLSPINKTSKHPSENTEVSHKFGLLNATNPDPDVERVFDRNIDVTLQTPAVRGRIECSPYETLANQSNWLQAWDLHNTSFWNTSINPKSPVRGYELLPVITLSPEMSTTTFADTGRILCCANHTDNEPGLSSIGYWSVNKYRQIDSEEDILGVAPYPNFTVKWIVGRAVAPQFRDRENASHFIWQEPPSMTAINCQPIIETADASVTVDPATGNALDFSISDSPNIVTSAWSDNFEAHVSTNSTDELRNDGQVNVTVR